MPQQIDIANWNRQSTYSFYKDFDDPFFNVTTPLDVSSLYSYCKNLDINFYLATLYYSTKVLNTIPAFRYRIIDDVVVEYEIVHPGSTILMDDHTFRFCYFDYVDDLKQFESEGIQKIKILKTNKDFDPGLDRLDMIHYSTLPWFSFTSFKHARSGRKASIPRIVFGKYYNENNKKQMPVSVEVNHALMDGYHVGLFINQLQEELNKLRS